jgi:hypothetical protein
MTKRKNHFLVFTFIIVKCGFIITDILWVVIGWSGDPDPTELKVPHLTGFASTTLIYIECQSFYF